MAKSTSKRELIDTGTNKMFAKRDANASSKTWMATYLLAFLLLVPSVVCGQESASSPIIAPQGLSTVFVLDSQGTEHRGKLIRVDADQLVIHVDATERTFKREAIRRVQKRGDSLKNGAMIGAIVGVSLGLLQAFTVLSGNASDQIAGLAVNTAVYTAIGVGLDASVQGRTLLYEASAGTPRIQRGGAAGFAFSIRW